MVLFRGRKVINIHVLHASALKLEPLLHRHGRDIRARLLKTLPVPDLAVLDLAGGAITDEGLQQLKGLSNLRSLDLRGTMVGKLVADIPQWFEQLEFLGLPKGALGIFSRMAMPRRIKLATGDSPNRA